MSAQSRHQRFDFIARAPAERVAATTLFWMLVALFARLALFRVDFREGRGWRLSSNVAVARDVRAFVFRRAVEP